MEDLVGVEIEQRDDDVVVARLTGELDISAAERTGRGSRRRCPARRAGSSWT